MKPVVLLLLFLPLRLFAGEDCGKIDSCNYSSMWANFSKFSVTYAGAKDEKGSTFIYTLSNGESLMTFGVQNGEADILSIPGVATLWRGIGKTGIKTSQDCRKDVRDTYAIIQSYAVRALFYLGFGVKGGPELVSNNVSVDVASKTDTRVQINPGDHMIIGGPWSITGELRKQEKITFNLVHSFTSEGNLKSLFLTGEWRDGSVVFPVESTAPLGEWLVCLAGEYSYEGGEPQFTSILEDTSGLVTVGDLRALTNRSRPTFNP